LLFAIARLLCVEDNARYSQHSLRRHAQEGVRIHQKLKIGFHFCECKALDAGSARSIGMFSMLAAASTPTRRVLRWNWLDTQNSVSTPLL
jgi:hypothetical protein